MGESTQTTILAAIEDLIRAIVPLAIDAAIADGRIQMQPSQGPDLGQRRYLTEGEVCELYGVKKSTLSYWRRKSRGPHFCKPGKQVIYAREDLDAYFNRERIRSHEADSAQTRSRR